MKAALPFVLLYNNDHACFRRLLWN